uniref:Type IV pilus biogenesis protein PilP n=1 Tax=Candidatus Kentrum sp. FM TaxID=2126340 RepID=A0A450TLU2_9GAMM|nr:MAG: hypothetical protein BECKFM1743A_GA0114220_104794 [Candidatus Kentron sp. FM]VFJ70629.1 MAG: hypothetical protein BECKFM1743C_GA0114222_105683 [Candidatus Kentron sp. FM]VFK18268.1 MAG: hypothetical protein BECKFM1743B_GA0114221_105343 [Candidatus Kentron sp. FM]
MTNLLPVFMGPLMAGMPFSVNAETLHPQTQAVQTQTVVTGRQRHQEDPGQDDKQPSDRRQTDSEPFLSGRLFFTEKERRELDRLRDRKRKTPATEQEQDMPAVESFLINGVVVRGNGQNTLWINGEPVSENSTSQANVRTIKRPDDTVHVEFSRGSNNIRLKPGQRVRIRGDEVSVEPH